MLRRPSHATYVGVEEDALATNSIDPACWIQVTCLRLLRVLTGLAAMWRRRLSCAGSTGATGAGQPASDTMRHLCGAVALDIRR